METLKKRWRQGLLLWLWLLAMTWQVDGGEQIIDLGDSLIDESIEREVGKTFAADTTIIRHNFAFDSQSVWIKDFNTGDGKSSVIYRNVQDETDLVGKHKVWFDGWAKRVTSREEKIEGTGKGNGVAYKTVFDEEDIEWNDEYQYNIVELKFIPPGKAYLLVIADDKSNGLYVDSELECQKCKNNETATHYYQQANNEITLEYNLLGVKAEDLESVILAIGDYTLHLPQTTGEKLPAIIRTKGGKLVGNDKDGKEVLYPAKGYWQKSKLSAKIKVTTKTKPYEAQSTDIEFTPLIADAKVTPADVLSNGFCPYTDEVKTFLKDDRFKYKTWNGATGYYSTAYGLSVGCTFPQDLSGVFDSIIFTVFGGDLNGEIKYEIADFVNFAKAGAGKIFEWEGFLNKYNLPRIGDRTILLSSNDGKVETVIIPGVDNVDMINAVRDLERESTICPLDVVKESDDYRIKISLKHPEYPEQKQTFEIHNLKVIYRF